MIRWLFGISSNNSISGRNSFKVNVISDYDDMRMYVEFHGCPVDFLAQFLDCKVPLEELRRDSCCDFLSGFCRTLI